MERKIHEEEAGEGNYLQSSTWSLGCCLLVPSVTSRRFLAERQKESPLCAEAASQFSSFISGPDRETREHDSHFKRKFDLRTTQERNQKAVMGKCFKREYKGNIVTDPGG